MAKKPKRSFEERIKGLDEKKLIQAYRTHIRDRCLTMFRGSAEERKTFRSHSAAYEAEFVRRNLPVPADPDVKYRASPKSHTGATP